MFRVSVFACVIVSVVSGCSNNDIDLTGPSLEFLSFSPAPQSGMVCGEVENGVIAIASEETLELSIRFTDNEALSQYKLEVHNNFDCHGHGGVEVPGFAIPPGVQNLTEDWEELDVVNLSGTDNTVDVSLTVPRNVTAGNYHFEIEAIDESGNENETGHIYSLIVANGNDLEPPVIHLDTPANMISIAKGSGIAFSGTVTDNQPLGQGGNGLLFLSYTNTSTGKVTTSEAVFAFDADTSLSYPFDFEFVIPGSLSTGTYQFTLHAHDGVRNIAAPRDIQVEITN